MQISGVTLRVHTNDTPSAWHVTGKPGFYVDLANGCNPSLRFDSQDQAKKYAAALVKAVNAPHSVPFVP